MLKTASNLAKQPCISKSVKNMKIINKIPEKEVQRMEDKDKGTLLDVIIKLQSLSSQNQNFQHFLQTQFL